MSVDGHRRAGEPQIDLETVRETIAMIHDDMKRSTRLQKVHAALSNALKEIAAVETAAPRQPAVPSGARVVAFPSFRPQFKPWTAGT